MRIALIGIQSLVLVVMAAITVAGWAGILSLGALGGGVGPAAMAAGVYILLLISAIAVALVAVVIPISILAGVTLICAILSGYRYLRWIRFAGIAVNAGAAVCCIVPGYLSDSIPAAVGWVLALYPVGNCLLFLLMPRRPSLAAARITAMAGVTLMFAFGPGLIMAACLAAPPDLEWWQYVIFILLLLLYMFPFYYLFVSIRQTGEMGRPVRMRILWSCIMTALCLLLILPLGLPLLLGMIFFLAVVETSIIYPPVMPPAGSTQYHAARILGRLPHP